MQMPERINTNITTNEQYRYAYNGMEVDNEVSGNGNSYTTEFRQYDPRLGRWKSLDPLMSMFPHMSPYCAFDNNPVFYTDPYGLSATNEGGPGDGVVSADPVVNKHTEEALNDEELEFSEGKLSFIGGEGLYFHEGSDNFVRGFYTESDYELMSDPDEGFVNLVYGIEEDAGAMGTSEDLARGLQGAVNQASGLNIRKGESYATKGGKTFDDYYTDGNGNQKKLYSSGGKVKSDFFEKSKTSSFGLYKNLDDYVKYVGPLGTASDLYDVGKSIYDNNGNPLNKQTGLKVLTMAADYTADRLLMIPTPVTIGAGLIIKGVILISGPSTHGGRSGGIEIDHRDNLHPYQYRTTLKPVSFPRIDYSKPIDYSRPRTRY